MIFELDNPQIPITTFFLLIPSAYPIRDLSLPITQWQGIKTIIGFWEIAFPTALVAFEFPYKIAISLYDLVFSDGISFKISQIEFWNGVPSRLKGKTNFLFGSKNKYLNFL